MYGGVLNPTENSTGKFLENHWKNPRAVIREDELVSSGFQFKDDSFT